MRENLNAIKRLVAFFLIILMISTTVCDDAFVSATEENHCTEFVDEQTYSDNVLDSVGQGDGYCDRCGKVEAAHVHNEVPEEPDEEIIEENLEEEPATDEPVVDFAAENPDEENQEIQDKDNADEVVEQIVEEEPEKTDTEKTDETVKDIPDTETTPEKIDEVEDTDKNPEEAEEEPKKEEEDCQHNWEYKSNKDGTHTKKCKECDKELKEDCIFGEDGKCQYCGYHEMTLEYQSFSKTVYGITVTVTGMMPKDSRVSIYNIGKEKVEGIINDNLEDSCFKAYTAFDITIYDGNGNKYQPQDDGNTVRVSFYGVNQLKGASEEEIAVYRIEDNNTVTEIESDIVGEDVFIEAEHFSTYVVGSDSNNHVELLDYEHFATIQTAPSGSADKAYLRVAKAKFDITAVAGETYNFDVTVYKNLKNPSIPTSGTVIASGSYEVTPEDAGDGIVEIDLTGNTNGYVSAGQTYSIVVSCSNEMVSVGYGKQKENGEDAPTYTTDTGSQWYRNEGIDQIFYIVPGDTIIYSATTSDSYDIESIKATKAKADSQGYLHYGKGDTDSLTAVIKDGDGNTIDRNITWSSGTPEVVSVDANGNIIALSEGSAEITASYVNASGTRTKTITIYVLKFTIDGWDPDGGTTQPAITYTGEEVKPTVLAYSSSGTTVSTTTTFSNNINASTATSKANVQISYTVNGETYTYNRSFTISPVALTAAAFADATPKVVNGEVDSITGITAINGVTPELDTDFTAVLNDTVTNSTGIKYTITITGKGNFTGTVTWEPQIVGQDISQILTAQLTSKGINLKDIYYTGTSKVLTADSNNVWLEVDFLNNDGARVTDIINADNADYVITDKGRTEESNITAGTKTITFTMKDGKGFTGSVSVDFTIQKADLSGSNISIKWAGDNYSFDHTGSAIEPKAGTDFDVYIGDILVPVADKEYNVSYVGNRTDVTDTPMVRVTGAGKNFDSTTYKQSAYVIVPCYKNDLIVRITDGTNYDGKATNGYVTGYSTYYNPVQKSKYYASTDSNYDATENFPNIKVVLPGTTITEGTDYKVEVFNDAACTVGLTKDVITGTTKYIKVTGLGTYASEEPIIARYTVDKMPLSSLNVITKNNVTRVFTGGTQKLTTATPSETSGKDIVIKQGTTVLEEGTDYEVTYSDNVNVGTATYRISAMDDSNYTGTLSGSKYKFTITKASMADGNSDGVTVGLSNDEIFKYDGKVKTPKVKVKIISGGVTTFEEEIDPAINSTLSTENYTVTYDQDPAPGTHYIYFTATENGNLKDSTRISYTITSNTKGYSIFVTGDNGQNAAEKMPSGHETTSTVTDADGVQHTVYTRYYYLKSDFKTYYSGKKQSCAISVYDSEGTLLVRGTDYSSLYSSTSVNAYTETDKSAFSMSSTPYIKITGLGSYQYNNAIIYFNIQPRNIDTTTVSGISDHNEWTGLVVKPTFNVTYGTTTLAVDTDYTAEYYDTYDADNSANNVLATHKAGKKTIVITGKGNFTGTKVIPYTVGTDLSESKVTIYGHYHNATSNPDIWYNAADNNSTINTPFNAYWRNGKEATVVLLDGTVEIDPSKYTVVKTSSIDGPVTYDVRPQDPESTIYNIITWVATANESQGFFGECTVYYKINPQDISESGSRMAIPTTMVQNWKYTGDDVTVEPELIFTYGQKDKLYVETTDISYKLVGGTDFKPDLINIGTHVGASISKAAVGIGNFTGTQVFTLSISRGDVITYSTVKNQGTGTVTTSPLGTSSANVDYDNIATYRFDGEEHCPEITLSATGLSKKPLVEGSDYTVAYPTDKKTVGTKEITVTVSGANYLPQTIKITYEIKSNSIESYYGTLSDVDYIAKSYGITDIENMIESGKLTLTLATGSDATATTLERGKDYVLVTSKDTDLDAINAQYSESYTDVIVAASADAPYFIPSYKKNYVFVKGIGTYSGYCKIPFSVVLDITSTASSGLAKVTFSESRYPLAQESTIRPTILYKLTPNAADYSGTILNATTQVDGAIKDVYTISRNNTGKPGPDNTLSVVGQYICKGKALSVKDESDNTICFLADLSGNTHGLMINPTVYDYTGSAVEPIISGILGTKGESPNGDYTINYKYKQFETETSTTAKTQAVDVGFYYAEITATADSDYYENSTGEQLSFFIKYNLDTATMTFVNPEHRDTIKNSVEYTGTAFSMAERTRIAITDGNYIFDYGEGKVSLVTLTPATVTNIGTYTITAKPADSRLVTGVAKATFRVTEVGLETNGTFTLSGNEFTYTGGEIKPTVTGKITTTDKTLVEGRDFRVNYHNNTNAGDNTAYVGIIGLGSYACDEFTPGLTFTIKPLNISTATNLEVEIDDGIYNGHFIDPTDATKGLVKVKPSYAVYSKDSNGVRYKLLEQTGTITNGDWKVEDSDWHNNTDAKEKNTTDPVTNVAPYITVKAGNSGNTTGQREVSFSIKQLDIGSGSVTLAQNTAEYTGGEIDVSNVVKLTTPYTDENGEETDIILTQKGAYAAVGDSLYDYEVTITKGNTNYPNGKIKDMGTYSITITGKNNCKGTRTEYFTITERSLSNNFHYYYDLENSQFVPAAWETCYDRTNKKYQVEDAATTGLKITIADVETISSSENPDNTPNLEVYDKGVYNTETSAYGRKLQKDVDYTISLSNNTEAGSAGWKKNGDEYTNADIAAGSPTVTITGIGNYKDSIQIPYNIGKNISNQGWKITFEATQLHEYVSTKADEPYNLTFTYNGTKQKPKVTIKDADGHSTVSSVSDYTLTFTDANDNEDAIVNAGYKYVVITGKGDYCGTIKQKYSILRKPITAKAYTHNEYLPSESSFTNEKPMIATSDGTANGTEQLDFTLSGGKLARFTEETAKKYLYDTQLVPTNDYKKFIGYYYLQYNGTEFKPTVTVNDKELTRNTTIDNEADLDIKYTNENTASTFKLDEINNEWKLDTYSDIAVGFKTVGADDTASKDISGIGNYYVASNSVVYHIRYIVLPYAFDKDFTVTFKNENDGNQYKYKGSEWEPEILVKAGTIELVEGTDYVATYTNNIYPGEATITVTGINNYKGEKELTFSIWGNLADTVPYFKDEDGTFVRGVAVQQYTGTNITYGDPEIYLFLDPDAGLTEANALKHDGTTADYKATGYSPISNTDAYSTGGKVTYTGQAPYWSGEKTITYDVAFDPDNVTIRNVQASYMYTGYDIIPDFKLSIPTATVNKTEFSKDDEGFIDSQSTFEEDYFKTPGKFEVKLTYNIGTSNTGIATCEYEIVPRPIGSCTIVYTKNQRYTGRQVQPMFTAYIESTNLKTGASQIYTLVKDKHYSVNYGAAGENIENIGTMKISGITDEIINDKYASYTIKLNRITGLGVVENTGTSITVDWNRDIYATGTELMLQKLNSTGQYVDCLDEPVTTIGKDTTYTFTGLTSSTNYRVKARAYADGNQQPSLFTTIDIATDIAQSDITVTSNAANSATISWTNTGDATLYYIYRASSPTDPGTIVAIVPASSTAFTNSGLTSGATYYYYVVGYYLSNAQLTKISTSGHVAVQVK